MNKPPLVCIVDDAADYRCLMKQLFYRNYPSYSVALFADGSALLEALSALAHLPNLILLDRHMPELDGYQTLMYLKGDLRYQHIPVVIMSSEASSAEIDACYQAGASRYLDKSLDSTLLIKQLDSLCLQ